MVQKYGPLHSHHFIPQIHSPTEAPAYLELTYGSRGIFYKCNGMVLGLNRFYLGIGPAHYLNRANILADIVPGNLNAMATQVNNGSSP